MIVTPDISALSVAQWKPSVDRLRRPGKLRALKSGATDTELRNAIAAGAGTLELYGADITLTTNAQLTLPRGLAVLDMTGTSKVRAGAPNTGTVVYMGNVDNSVWSCGLDGQGNMTETGRFIWMDARDNIAANTHFENGSGQTLGVRVAAGGRKASILGCTSTGLWTTVNCSTADVEDGTHLIVDAMDCVDGTRRYIFTVAVNGKLKTWISRSILRKHSDTSAVFQHVAQQASTGRYQSPRESGVIYQGNGLAYEKDKADNLIAPNGCADQASIHGADDARRFGVIGLDGGEAFNVFSRGTDVFESDITLAINLDTGVAIGAKFDDPNNTSLPDPLFLTKNGTVKRHVGIGTGLDRAEDHGGSSPLFPNGGEFGIVGQDSENITVEDIVVVGPGTTSQKTVPMTEMSGMKRAAQFNRSTNITFSGLRSHAALLTPEALVSET